MAARGQALTPGPDAAISTLARGGAPDASPWAIALARFFPRVVGRRRGYRVMDRALRAVFGAGLRGTRRVAHAGAVLEYDLDEYIERLMAYEWFGEESFAMARALLRAGDTVVDAGAHVGSFSALAAAAVGSVGSVYSIEANPRQVERLRHHAAINGGGGAWHIIPGALAPRAGDDVLLHVAACQGDASLAAPDNNEATVPVAVRTITFDDLAAGWGKVALLKIDIEGAEPGAFAGGRAWMSSDAAPDFIIAEFNPMMLGRMGSSPGALLEMLVGFGYAAYTMRWRGAARVVVAPAGDTPDLSANTDLLLCRRGREGRLASFLARR